MPSKEEFVLSPNQVTTTGADFLSEDMEQLVSEIKENLRLSAASLKARPSYNNRNGHGKSSRPSPYIVPCRSWSEPTGCDNCVRTSRDGCLSCSKKLRGGDSSKTSDDPYEMLQELLRDGSLIKEAVRRLQINLTPKQTYFYDSEEDSRSPVLKICHVET